MISGQRKYDSWIKDIKSIDGVLSMEKKEEFKPYVPAERNMPELTPVSIILGMKFPGEDDMLARAVTFFQKLERYGWVERK